LIAYSEVNAVTGLTQVSDLSFYALRVVFIARDNILNICYAHLWPWRICAV